MSSRSLRSFQLSVALPFGTQDFRFFDDAEPFEIVTTPTSPLSASPRICTQGYQDDQEWSCSLTNVTHRVCGHRGTLAWKSPTYSIEESAGYLPVTLMRTGGGYGAFEVSYALVHEGTNRSDVTPTVAYTTGQTIAFPEGVIEMTFRIMIHDDRDYEGDERFYLSLREPTGSSSTVTLGPQRITYVTIVDDDQALTGWSDTKVYGDFDCIAGRRCEFTIEAYSTVGTRQYTGGDRWMVILSDQGVEPSGDSIGGFGSAWTLGQQQRTPLTYGNVTDLTNGTYAGSWRLEKQGVHVLHAYLAVGGDDEMMSKDWTGSNGGGGLLGTYYDSAFLEPSAMSFSRVDQVRRHRERTIGRERTNERTNEHSMLLFSCVRACAVWFLFFGAGSHGTANQLLLGDQFHLGLRTAHRVRNGFCEHSLGGRCAGRSLRGLHLHSCG